MAVIRPSKIFLFDLLEEELKHARGEIGIDAAAANFKSRRLFRTKKYYGIDIDAEALAEGKRKFAGDETTIGFEADIRDLSRFGEGQAAAVVSTNTLHQLSAADRIRATKELARLVGSDGLLFVELPIDFTLPAIRRYLETEFRDVKMAYYKNPISRAYEALWERDGDLGEHPVAGLQSMRLISWLLSRLEFLTSAFQTGNRHAIIICRGKREKP